MANRSNTLPVVSPALLSILVLATALRIWFAWDNPYTGDEVTSVLNASMYRAHYYDLISYDVRPVADYQRLLTFTGDYDLSDLVQHFITNSRGHPPLYYGILHCVIRFIGDSTLLIRMVSILCSILSVLFIYQIAHILGGRRAACLSALFMAIAPFPIFYSMMVRPYPMAMALSLGTTALLLKLIQTDTFDARSPRIYVFSIFSALGFYTIYHYGLTIVFQFTLLLFSRKWDRVHFTRLILAGAVLSLLIAPWIITLFAHMDTVRNDTQPHNGPNESIWIIVKTLVHLNFTKLFTISAITYETPPILIRSLRAALFLSSFGLIAFGIYRVTKSPFKWSIPLAFLTYYATNLTLDLTNNIHSLSMEKLQFLPVTFSLVFIATALEKPFPIKNYSMHIWPFFTMLFLAGSLHICVTKPRYEDPFTLPEIQSQVRKHSTERPYLFISNTHSERQFFSSITVLPEHGDYFLFRRKFYPENLSLLANLKQYDVIFLCNFFARGFDDYVYTDEELETISAHIIQAGFVRIQPDKIDRWTGVDHLLIFTAATEIP